MLSPTGAVDTERDDDVGAQRADVPDEVAEDLRLAPFLQRLLGAERVTEVRRASEVLLGAVVLMRREQLLGAEDAERVEQLGADLVLATVAARRRDQRHTHAQATRVPRQHRVVLVIRMSRRLHQRADGVQLAQRHGEPGRSGEVADLWDAVLRRALLRRAGEGNAPNQQGKDDAKSGVHKGLSVSARAARSQCARTSGLPGTRSAKGPFNHANSLNAAAYRLV